ncbi:MAG: hypothetical protein LC797_02900 [Chloroflexi bacterium]|nr:hypothetical protein [Chloroflexota bacterium]
MNTSTALGGHATGGCHLRRGFYQVVEAVPARLVFAWTWNPLAEAI